MSNTTQATWYANMFKGWQVKQLGDKPTDEMLATAHAFGKPGKQSLALAMAMRPAGVTAAQVVIACGAPQNNHRRQVIEKGYFKREAAPANDAGHTTYKIALTKKGEAKVASVAKRAADDAAKGDTAPAKGKAPKAAKGKRKAAKQAAATPAPVSETAPEVPPVTTGEAPQGDAANVTA